MADEFLAKIYLELHGLLADVVLTPREKKLIDIITRQNRALETIAASTLDKSPAEIATLAKANTVMIAEKGSKPIPISQYVAESVPADPEPPKPPEPSKSEGPRLVMPTEAPTTVGGGARYKQDALRR